MSVNHDSYITLTVIVMALYVASCHGQENSCDINSRPHPQGICGPRLARAHSNLCFLLSQAYPEHFPGKRSVDGRTIIDRIYNIPLSILADIDIRRDNWNALLNKREYPNAFYDNAVLVPSDYSLGPSPVQTQPDFADIKGSTRPWLKMMRSRAGRSKRVVPRPSMVCECCYNVCTPRHLATYC